MHCAEALAAKGKKDEAKQVLRLAYNDRRCPRNRSLACEQVAKASKLLGQANLGPGITK
jgi:hypothetical protein